MPDSNLTTSIAAIRAKILNDAPTATVDTLMSLARAAKSVGLTEDAAVENAINSRALTLSSGATTADMVKLSNTIKQVRNETSSSGLSDISQLTDSTNIVPTTLANLTDVHTTTPTDGQTLVWDNANSRYVPSTPAATGATTGYVDTAIANLVDTSPAALDTLNELAAALNDDATFSTTVTNSIATKLSTTDFTSTADTWAGTVATHIIPSTDVTYDLGSSTHKFRDLYLDGNTLNLGTQTISASATGIILPELTIGTGTNKVKLVASTSGKLEQTGTNSSGTVAPVVNVPTILSDLSDVHTTTGADGQVLTWDNANSRWHPATASAGGATTIGALNDVNNATPTDGQVLTWDNSNSYWKPLASAGGGSSVTVSDTAPASPSAGDQWFDSTAGTLSVYYNDGSSSQWILVSGSTGPAGPTGTDGTDGTAGAAGAAGTAGYATVVADMTALIAVTGMVAGQTALVTALNKVFMYTGTAWYLVATMTNDSPTAITGVTATTSLATDGTATIITAVSTDPEGFPLTWSYAVTTGSLGSTATVSQADNVFTITPSSTEADAGSFSITFSVTDGATGAVSAVSAFTLAFWGGDFANASYDSVSLSFTSQDTTPKDIVFNTTGTKMYMVGGTNDSVYQYSLSTGFDLSTASYDSVSFSVTGQDTGPIGIAFNPTGTKMYMVGNTNDSVYQYSLSTGFDLSTASYDSVSFSIASHSDPRDIAFNPTGTKMYLVGFQYQSVYQYSLSTGFDLSTASYDSVSFSVTSQDTGPLGIAFNTTGTKMYILGYTNKSVYQYSV
jgi:hypothetical protein